MGIQKVKKRFIALSTSENLLLFIIRCHDTKIRTKQMCSEFFFFHIWPGWFTTFFGTKDEFLCTNVNLKAIMSQAVTPWTQSMRTYDIHGILEFHLQILCDNYFSNLIFTYSNKYMLTVRMILIWRAKNKNWEMHFLWKHFLSICPDT